MRVALRLVCILGLYSSSAFAASIYDVFIPLHVADGKPAWGAFRLGMSLEEVRRLVSGSIQLTTMEADFIGVALQRASIQYESRRLNLTFDSRVAGEIRLSAIRVTRQQNDDGASWERRVMLREVKKRLPGLMFKPSRHAPEVTESENDRPFYTLSTSTSVLVRVEPGYSIHIANDYLYD